MGASHTFRDAKYCSSLGIKFTLREDGMRRFVNAGEEWLLQYWFLKYHSNPNGEVLSRLVVRTFVAVYGSKIWKWFRYRNNNPTSFQLDLFSSRLLVPGKNCASIIRCLTVCKAGMWLGGSPVDIGGRIWMGAVLLRKAQQTSHLNKILNYTDRAKRLKTKQKRSLGD